MYIAIFRSRCQKNTVTAMIVYIILRAILVSCDISFVFVGYFLFISTISPISYFTKCDLYY